LVAIRKALRYWTSQDKPIPVLVPWGSRKACEGLVDVAEIMALRQLEALNKRVSAYYSPGTVIHIGVEDLGGYYMWATEEEGWIASAARYVDSMVALPRILDMDDYIEVVKESDLVQSTFFRTAADDFFAPILAHLNGTDQDALAYMQKLGWVGGLPSEMVRWYMDQYESIYPGRSTEFKFVMLARYLAQSAARYKVGAKFKDKSWAGMFMQVNFPQPVPGVPDTMASRRLYYRTLPMHMARSHMPPWRAKGYLRIRDEGTQTVTDVKLAHPREEREYSKLTLDMRNYGRSVLVSADYMLL